MKNSILFFTFSVKGPGYELLYRSWREKYQKIQDHIKGKYKNMYFRFYRRYIINRYDGSSIYQFAKK